MKKLKFLAIIIAIIALSGCSKTCYDQNNQPYDCTTGIPNNGGGGTDGNYPWWNGPFTGVQTIQVRVKEGAQLKSKQNFPQNCSVLSDMDRNGYSDMYLMGIDHRNNWVQGLITYNGATYWMKFTTTDIGAIVDNSVVTVTVSNDQTKPFALNVNSYSDFGFMYYDQTGRMPFVTNNSAMSQLYNAEAIYARQ